MIQEYQTHFTFFSAQLCTQPLFFPGKCIRQSANFLQNALLSSYSRSLITFPAVPSCKLIYLVWELYNLSSSSLAQVLRSSEKLCLAILPPPLFIEWREQNVLVLNLTASQCIFWPNFSSCLGMNTQLEPQKWLLPAAFVSLRRSALCWDKFLGKQSQARTERRQ